MAAKFKKNPDTERKIISALSGALDKAAIVYKETAESQTPVKSGKLKAGFKIEEPKKLKRTIKNDVEYAATVEFGNLKRSPNPFMRNAAKISKNKIFNLFKGIF